jgi:hypothetical protein
MTFEEATKGLKVRILNYPAPVCFQYSDARTGEIATVTSKYNGLVLVNRQGYIEPFIPERLEVVR